jgi:hypothetical protein
MSDDDLDRQLRDRLQRVDLPSAPAGLRVRLAELRSRAAPERRRASRGWWVTLVPIAAVLVLGLSGLLAGAPSPSSSPSPPTSPGPTTAAEIQLTLVTFAACNSIGGCVGYVSLVKDGEPEGPMTRLSQVGDRGVTQGLPATIEPGRYVIRAHTSFMSDDIENGQPPDETVGPQCSTSVDAAAGTAIVVTIWFGSDACRVTIVSTVQVPGGLAGLPTTVDGLNVMTVSEVLAARANGGLDEQAVALGGYWSDGSFGHSCAAPDGPTGELEIYCHDGESGITENDEPIMVVDHNGSVTMAAGPALTPWFPGDLDRLPELYNLPFINGQRHPPVPIVVIGHFDDPRAQDCRPVARQLCLDRLVVDRIVAFELGAVPTPGVTPTPTPFPSPAPSGLFPPEWCGGDVVHSFVGWTTTAELDVGFEREGYVWAVVTAEPVLLGGEGWNEDPNGSGARYRPWGRLICMTQEGQQGTMEFGHVPGSAYWEWEDGRRTPIEP